MADEQKERVLHSCGARTRHDGYGEAITDCIETAGRPGEFWAGNGEYGSQVAFCPYCGAKAPVQPVPGEHGERR